MPNNTLVVRPKAPFVNTPREDALTLSIRVLKRGVNDERGNLTQEGEEIRKYALSLGAEIYGVASAAYLAGLGTMGLNCSLISPEHGPRMWLTSIITDKELPTGEPLEEEVCTKCGNCVDVCPSRALDGEGWKNVYRSATYGCCGSCIAICPVGEK